MINTRYILLLVIFIIFLIVLFISGKLIKPKDTVIIKQVYEKIKPEEDDSYNPDCPVPRRGLPGFPGVQGEKGIQGIKGMIGFDGYQGFKGNSIPGPQGPQGATGYKGGQKVWDGTIILPDFDKLKKTSIVTGIGDFSLEGTTGGTGFVKESKDYPDEWFLSPLNFKHNNFPYKFKFRIYLPCNDVKLRNIFRPIDIKNYSTERLEYDNIFEYIIQRTKKSSKFIPFDLVYGPNDPRNTYMLYRFMSRKTFAGLNPDDKKALSVYLIDMVDADVYLISGVFQGYGNSLSSRSEYIDSTIISFLPSNTDYGIEKTGFKRNILSDASVIDSKRKFFTAYFTELKKFKPIQIVELPKVRYTEEYFITMPNKEISYFLRPAGYIAFLVNRKYVGSLNNGLFKFDNRDNEWLWCKFKLVYGPNIPSLLKDVYKFNPLPNDESRDPQVGMLVRRYYEGVVVSSCSVMLNKDVSYSKYYYLYNENLVLYKDQRYKLGTTYTSDNRYVNVITKLIYAYRGGYCLSLEKTKGDKLSVERYRDLTTYSYYEATAPGKNGKITIDFGFNDSDPENSILILNDSVSPTALFNIKLIYAPQGELRIWRTYIAVNYGGKNYSVQYELASKKIFFTIFPWDSTEVGDNAIIAGDGAYRIDIDGSKSKKFSEISNKDVDRTELFDVFLDELYLEQKAPYTKKYLLAKCDIDTDTQNPKSKNLVGFVSKGFIRLNLDWKDYVNIYENDEYKPTKIVLDDKQKKAIANYLKIPGITIGTQSNEEDYNRLLESLPDNFYDRFNQKCWFEIVYGEPSPENLLNKTNLNNLLSFSSSDRYNDYISPHYLIPANEPGGCVMTSEMPGSSNKNISYLQYRFLRDINLSVSSQEDKDEAESTTATEFSTSVNQYLNFINYKKENNALEFNNPATIEAINFDDETGFYTRDWYKFGLWYFETYLKQI